MSLLRRSGCVQASVVRAGSCGLRSALCRSPAETYRLHHNIKASECRVIDNPESKLSPQANTAGELRAGGGGKAGGAMGWQRSRSSPGAGETRWVYDAGAVRGPRSAPAGRHGAGRFVCKVAVRGLRSALVGRPNTSAAMKRSAVCGPRSALAGCRGASRSACRVAVRGLRSALAGRSAQRACGAGKAFGCAHVLFGVRFRCSDFAVCDADALSPHLLGPFAEKRPQI